MSRSTLITPIWPMWRHSCAMSRCSSLISITARWWTSQSRIRMERVASSRHRARSVPWRVAAALVLCAATPVCAQQQPPPVGFGRAVGQTAVGVVGLGVGFVGTGLATQWIATHWFRASEDQASSIALGAAYAGATLGAAAGPAIVGPGSSPSGTYWGALAGSAVGGVGSFLLVRLNRAVDLGTIPRIISTAAVFTLPAIGATVGYNLSRH